MSYLNETNPRELIPFVLPTMMDTGFDAEDLGDDFDGLSLSFKKLKIPAGGVLQFEEPGADPDNPEYVKSIEGVILYNHASNAFWAAGMEYDENSSPMCSSYDGKCGHGTPGGTCATCEMNQYGTDQGGGKGKACKNMRTLYILRSGEAMPVQLSLPPTSLRPFNDFANALFVTRQRPTWATIVKIGLRRVENGNNQYSVATFGKIRDLAPDEVVQMKAYAGTFRAQAKEMLQQRALEAENRANSDDGYETMPSYSSTGDGDHFVVMGADTLNGDTDALPM